MKAGLAILSIGIRGPHSLDRDLNSQIGFPRDSMRKQKRLCDWLEVQKVANSKMASVGRITEGSNLQLMQQRQMGKEHVPIV